MSDNPSKRWAREVQRCFGSNVRQLREGAEMSQVELGRRTGLHATYVSAVERGVRNPGYLNVVRLARGLGVDPSELFAGIPRRPPPGARSLRGRT